MLILLAGSEAGEDSDCDSVDDRGGDDDDDDCSMDKGSGPDCDFGKSSPGPQYDRRMIPNLMALQLKPTPPKADPALPIIGAANTPFSSIPASSRNWCQTASNASVLEPYMGCAFHKILIFLSQPRRHSSRNMLPDWNQLHC